MIAAQLPDASSTDRTMKVMQQVTDAALKVQASRLCSPSRHFGAGQQLHLVQRRRGLCHLDDWASRYKTKDQGLLSIYENLTKELNAIQEAKTAVLVPPAIQGIGNASGFTMQPQLRGGNFDYTMLERVTNALVDKASSQSALTHVSTPFRAGSPQLQVEVNRIKAETLGVTVGQVFSTISSYVGSTYVTQINKFGNVFQVYVQADAGARVTAADLEALKVRTPQGNMVPLGTLIQVKQMQGPPLISLYNLYPSATVVGAAARASPPVRPWR